MSRRLVLILIALGFGFVAFAQTPLRANAASLYFSPAEKSVDAGTVFTVAVKVSSPDQAMNAASGDISFPTNELQVVSVSKLNSVMNLWVRDPSFSNAPGAGDVHFEGVVLNPGFIGTGGTVIQITFQVVGHAGESVPLTFSSGAVLANDGNGTNILTSEGTANFTIQPKPVPAAAPVIAPPVVASTSPVASSSVPAVIVLPVVPASSVSPQSVVVHGWFPGAYDFFLAWGLIIFLVLLWIAAVIVLVDYIVGRSRRSRYGVTREIINEREELRDDLKRIEKELEADSPRSAIDLSSAGMKKKQKIVQREIEHIEEDLKKDIKNNS